MKATPELEKIEKDIAEVYRKMEMLDEDYKRKRERLESKLDKLAERLNKVMSDV